MAFKFENLDVWKVAVDLSDLVYRATGKYPKSEVYALTSQTNRAVVSISANIAEGSARGSKKDFNHFLDIALGSAFELRTLMEIAHRRKYVDQTTKDDINNLIQKCVMLAYGLKRSLNEKK